MPTFVIFQMGHEPSLATFESDGVRIGRDDSNDLVLTGRGVSREHALIYRRESGEWMAYCSSEKNPVVLDGAMLRGDADLSEGSEILIGPETLLVFCLTDAKARSFMGQKGHYAATRCQTCGWKGMLSTVRKEILCPSCSSLDVVRTDKWQHEDADDGQDHDATTEFIDKDELKGALKRLRAAKRSRLERIDGRETLKQAVDLSETETVKVAKSDAALELFGFVFGGGLEIAWSGNRYTVRNHVSYPGVKINGTKITKVAPLADGDVIEIGSNRFKMVTG